MTDSVSKTNSSKQPLDPWDRLGTSHAVCDCATALAAMPDHADLLEFNLMLSRRRYRRGRKGAGRRIGLYRGAAGDRGGADRPAWAGPAEEVLLVDPLLVPANTDLPSQGFEVTEPDGLPGRALDLIRAQPLDALVLQGFERSAVLLGLLYKLVWDTRVIVLDPAGAAAVSAGCDAAALTAWLPGREMPAQEVIAREVAALFDAVCSPDAADEVRRALDAEHPVPALEALFATTGQEAVFRSLGGWHMFSPDTRLAVAPGTSRLVPSVLAVPDWPPPTVAPGPARVQRIVVYTVCTGNSPPPPHACAVTGVRAVLLTDRPALDAPGWEVLPFDGMGLSPARAAFVAQMLPHRFLPEHDISVWVTPGRVLGGADLPAAVVAVLGDAVLAAPEHPDSAHDLVEAAIKAKRTSKGRALVLRQTLRTLAVPSEHTLPDTGLLIRRDSAMMRQINALWLRETMQGADLPAATLAAVLWRAEVPLRRIAGVALEAFAAGGADAGPAATREGDWDCAGHPDLADMASDRGIGASQQALSETLAVMRRKAAKDGTLAITNGRMSAICAALLELDLLGVEEFNTARRTLANTLFDQTSVPALGSRRVAYIPNSPMPTAAANNVHVMKMCAALAGQGCDVTVYSERDPEWVGDDASLRGQFGLAHAFPLVLVEKDKRGRENLLYRLVRQAIADGCCHIYTRSLSVAYYACLADIPVIFEEHKLPKDTDLAQYRFILRSPALLRFVVISAALARFFGGLHHDAAGKIAVLHDAADPVVPDAVPPFVLQDLPGTQISLGYVGHLYPGKGAELSVEIARAMPHVGVHMLGGTDEDVARWRDETRDLPNIVFYGHRPHGDVPGFIEAIDACIAPFLRHVGVSGGGPNVADVFSPLKIFEYMAHGKPIVTSDLPVLREVLTHGETALMCDPDTPDSFVAAIDALRADPDEAWAMGARAREHFQTHYTWSRRAELVRDMLFARSAPDPCLPPVYKAPAASVSGAAALFPAPPLVRWDFGLDQSGWAYGINTRRITARIDSLAHVFAADDPEVRTPPDVALAFDLTIMRKPRFRDCGARRRILRVGGPNPLRACIGGDDGKLAEVLRGADAIIALSPQLRDRLAPLHPRVCFIPNGIDLLEFHPLRRFRWPDRLFTVGVAASMASEAERNLKGYHFAQEACSAAGAELLMIGRGINHVPHERLIEDFYARIDVLLHPVDAGKEASSNVIMEALAIGIPVVTTRHAGFHGGALTHGQEGLIMRRNSADLAAALAALRDDPALRETLAAGGRAFAERHHDIDVVARQYEQVIHACLEN